MIGSHPFAGRFVGGGALDGRIVGLRAAATPVGTQAAWEHTGVTDARHRLAVVVDGEASSILPTGTEQIFLPPLAAGTHRTEIRLLRPEARRLANFHGTPHGRHPYLTWPASTDESTRGYRIYADARSGTVNYATAIGEVDGTAIHRRYWAAADAGTGLGRLSVGGEWQGADGNRLVTVEVVAGGYRHDLTGTWSAAAPIRGDGQAVNLAWGARLVWESPASLYEVGDSWQFRIGPPTAWRSAVEMAEGVWKFGVRAVDAAGNLSATGVERSIALAWAPDPVSGASLHWSGTQFTLAWTLPADSDLDAVLLYSNWSRTFERLADWVLEDGPWATLSASAVGYVFTPGELGEWQFQIRTRDTAGRISDSIEVLVVDAAGLATGTALREPEGVTVTPIAGGKFLLSWRYPLEDGGDVTEFRIYINEAEDDPLSDDPAQTVVVSSLGPSRDVALYSVETGSFAAERWFTVRASDGAVETTNVERVAGVPDLAGPAFAGPVAGARD